MSVLDRIHVVLPGGIAAETCLADLTSAPDLRPFSTDVTGFVKSLSDAIMRAPTLRTYPETIAFGYWIRAAQLDRMANAFSGQSSSGLLTPRGVAFHIAPSNVDTIFLYSLIISLLVGNRNIVRVSSKESPQVSALIQILETVLDLPQHTSFRHRLVILRYEHDEAITAHLSSIADIRVIWGGDSTVNAIRRIPLPPRSVELTFPDKVSLCVLDAEAYLAESKPAQVAKSFADDAYWFGQMACSSPRVVLWRGSEEKTAAASKRFWEALELHLAHNRPDLTTMDFMNKLVAEQTYAVLSPSHIRASRTNVASVVRVENVAQLSLEDHCGGGFFIESRITELDDLKAIVTPRHQTVTSYGVERREWTDFLDHERPSGIDRIVPIGEALTFAAVWDGQDLFRSFCRDITVAIS